MNFRINTDTMRSVLKKAGMFFAKDSKDWVLIDIEAVKGLNAADKPVEMIVFRCGGRFSALDIVVKDGIDIGKDGKIVLQFETLNKIISNTKEKTIDFDATTYDATITVGSSSFKLCSVDVYTFPPIDFDKQKTNIKIPADKFCTYAKAVAQFADQTASQAVFGGVLFRQQDGYLNLVATDSRSMCTGKIALDENYETGFEAVIQNYQVEVAAKIFETCLSEDGNITLYLIDDNKCVFTDGFTTYSAGLICGKYPKVDRVFQHTGYFRLTLDVKEILTALNQAEVVIAREYEGVFFEMKDNVLTLKAESPDFGQATINLDYPISDTGIVKLNCAYIIRAIKAAGTDPIVFNFPKTGKSPVVINPDEPLRIAVMPLSIG